MPDNSRLQAIIVVAILIVVMMAVVYNAGLSRGRLGLNSELMTAQTEVAAVSTTTPTATITPLLLVPSPTPTETGTPTASPTSTNTATPTQTPTPTTTPASPQEWGERFQDVAVQALNELSISDFTAERGQALIRRIAQEQGLTFVPVAHFPLQGTSWGAFVVPRTPQGQALPLLFWRDPNDFNRIRSQLLLDELSATSNGYDYSRFYGGISHGVLRADYIGRFHLLLIEHPEAYPRISAHVLMQSQPSGPFERLWFSSQQPFWTLRAGGSQIILVDTEASVLPDIEVYAPLDRGRDLREQVGAADTVLEQTPFARQWAETRWRYITVEGALDLAGVVEPGYNLQTATLVETPLTSLARFLHLLRSGDVSEASDFTTRFDLLQEAFNLGLGEAGDWLALYVDETGRPLFGAQVTDRLLLFDNRDRSRTYSLRFESAPDGGIFRIAGVNETEPYLAADLITPVPAGVAMEIAPTATPEPTETATPTPVPTEPGTPTPTLTPLPTATETATVTDTPLPTDTPTPGPIPAIPDDEPSLGMAIVFRSPANLRGGPATDYPSVAQLGYGVNLELYGITEEPPGEPRWIVVRINDPSHEQNGEIGWIAQDLLQVTAGDLSVLPPYSQEGLALAPPTPGPTPTPAPPTPTEPPTPRPTPVLSQPGVSPLVDLIAPPGPGEDEQVYTIAGESIPANPFAPVPAVGADGSPVQLVIDMARVQIWNGAFGVNPPDWTGAPAELLWPNSEVYVVGVPDDVMSERIEVQRVRIARGPSLERVRLQQIEEYAAALNRGDAVALTGSREEPGIYLLETQPDSGGERTGGALRQLWIDEQEATWAGGETEQGVVVSAAGTLLGRNRFTWLRSDGQGIQIMAQPFHAFQGVAGDVFGGLWWIETPQVDVNQWQLWHYDPVQGQIRLRLRAAGDAFATETLQTALSLTPQLLAAQPTFHPETGAVTEVTLVVDTLDAADQRLYAGVYRLSVALPKAGMGTLQERATLLLGADNYRGPLQVNADGTRIAYFVYDPEHPSLTSGFIRPPNTLRVLTIDASGASTIRTVYASENRFEFLAPNLAWQGTDRLIVARSRFAAGEIFGLDRFGITSITLPAAAGDEPTVSNYLFPNRRELRDFAACRQDSYILAIVQTENGDLELARWDSEQRPTPLFLLPPNHTRTFLCWQVPDILAEGS